MTKFSNKKIAVIITWSFNHDSRALRTVKSLSVYFDVDVFYIPKSDDDKISWNYSNNVKFHKMKKPKNNFLNKILKNSLFFLQYNYFIKEIISTNKYDILYIHDLIAGYIGLSLKKKLNCKLIYDIHDLYTETLNQEFPETNIKSMKIKHRVMFEIMKFFGSNFEQRLINKSDIIYTVNESCANWLSNTYNKKIHFFRNFPEYKDKPTLNNFLYRETYIDENNNIALYIGGLNNGRNLINIVKSANYLDEKNKIIIVGEGGLKNKLIEIAKNDKTLKKNIFFLNFIDYKNLFRNISSADIGLMILDPINKSKELALANKIFEYMLCGIVPLLSDHVEHNKLDPSNDFTFKIKNYSPQNISKTINEIFKNEKLILEKSKKCRYNFERKFNWNIEEDKFINPLKKISLITNKK